MVPFIKHFYEKVFSKTFNLIFYKINNQTYMAEGSEVDDGGDVFVAEDVSHVFLVTHITLQ